MHKTTNDRIRHPAKFSHATKTQRSPREKYLTATIVTATKQASHKARRHHTERLRIQIALSKMIAHRRNRVRKIGNARIATAATSPHAAKVGAGSTENVRFSAPDKTPGPMVLNATSLHHHRRNKVRAKIAAITHKPALNQWNNTARATDVTLDITGTTSGKTSVATVSNMEWSARVGTTTGATARNSNHTAPALRSKASAAWMRARKMDAILLLEGQTRKNYGTFLK